MLVGQEEEAGAGGSGVMVAGQEEAGAAAAGGGGAAKQAQLYDYCTTLPVPGPCPSRPACISGQLPCSARGESAPTEAGCGFILRFVHCSQTGAIDSRESPAKMTACAGSVGTSQVCPRSQVRLVSCGSLAYRSSPKVSPKRNEVLRKAAKLGERWPKGRTLSDARRR